MSTEPLLSVANIETFYGPIQAIRGISLEVPQGKIITVLGANGAGKTTILKTISGVMDPERGQIRFDGHDIMRMSPDKVMRRGICHSPEGREMFPFLTVHENLVMGSYSRNDKADIAQDLEMCYELLSAPEGAPAPARRPDVGRRAADARDQPRADGPSQAPAAR